MTAAYKQLPPTERRCEDCDPGVSWGEAVAFCPHHGKTVKVMLVPQCECGAEIWHSTYRFCAKCGKPVEAQK